MNQLLKEQIQLHFGEDHEVVVTQTERFCRSILGRPWWGRNRSVMLNNEGGLTGMQVQALMYIIAENDIGVGLKAYSLYLRAEYGSDKLHHSHLDDSTLIKEETSSQSTLLAATASPSGEDLQSLDGLLDKTLRTQEEQEFFLVYASVGSVRETAELLGMTASHGMKLWDRVHHRAKRKVQRR